MKMLIKLMSVLVMSVTLLTSYAQTGTGKVSGKVGDANQATLNSASISLLKAKDSSVIKMSVANKEGRFEFENVPAGKYLLSATAVGHIKKFSKPFDLADGASVEAEALVLAPSTKELGAVTVTASRPPVEQKIDRIVVNVEASITNAGQTALDVLEKSPGIVVDKDGNISLKGKSGVVVMMDGRPTYLGASDLANLLRSMPSSQLDQIEIMTNPPARFDASGNSGVINIKTKRNKQFGYNGTVNLGYGIGRYAKFNESVNFNYRNQKINFFSGLNFNSNKGFNNLDIQRRFRDKTTKEITSNFTQEARMLFRPKSYSARAGLDYFVSKKTTLGVVVNGFYNPTTRNNNNITDVVDQDGNFEGETRATMDQEQKWKSFSSNFNLRQLLDTTGGELTADFDYVVYDSRNNQEMINSYFDQVGNPTEKPDTLMGNLPQNIKIHSGRIDYLRPLKKGMRFEAGIKSSYVKTDNNAIYDSITYNVIVPDTGRSNHFVYEENINAAYVNFSAPLNKKWSAQLGLRVENTNAKGDQITKNITFDRHYTQLFPTAYLQYVHNKTNTFVLNYGRRIRRPDYESLNPFINFIDKYTYSQGNPNLKPQFSHNIELSHTYRNFLTTTLNYFVTKDIIQNVLDQITEEQKTFVRRDNIANQRQFGISVNANHPITKWWRSSIYANVFNNRFEGIVGVTPITVQFTSFTMNGSQTFTFAKTWNAEINGFFRSAGIEGVIKAKSMGMIAAGIGKQIWKGKGTIRVSVRDIFYSQQFRAESRYGTVDAAFQEARDSRVLNLNFTYRFNKGKMNGQQRKRNNGPDETNRVGVGG
jgi:iron complex outermembrane recepter protein